jgi:hypothetical protein
VTTASDLSAQKILTSYPNVPHHGKQSRGDWMLEQTRALRPIDAAPPPGVETYADWYERIRGLPLSGEAQHPTYRGHGDADRIRARRAMQTTSRPRPQPVRTKGMAERFRDFVLDFMPKVG